MRPRRQLSIKQRVLLVAASSLLALAAALVFLQARQWNRDANAFHIYVLGGSSAWGEPYAPHVPDVLGRLVSAQFGDRISGRHVKVVTLAQAGADLLRVEETIKDIVAIPHAPGTAIALMYAGHNEFIWSDGHRDLRGNPRHLIDSPVVDPGRRQEMLEQYLSRVANITTRLRKANIPVIISTVAANVRDWDPNRSCVVNPEHGRQVTHLWSQADQAEGSKDWAAARTALTKLLELEPGFAHAHFLMGRVLEASGDLAAARVHYQHAVDFDGNPTRIVSQQNAALRDFCASNNVPLADSLKVMEEASIGGVVGANLIWDNVHPKLEGFILMAKAFGERVEEVTGTPRKHRTLELASVEKKLGIHRELMGIIYAGRGQTCYGHATRTWDQAQRLSQAEDYFTRALEIHPKDADILCSVAVMQLMRGEMETSLKTWQRARELDAEITGRRLGNLHVRQLFARHGVKNAIARLE